MKGYLSIRRLGAHKRFDSSSFGREKSYLHGSSGNGVILSGWKRRLGGESSAAQVVYIPFQSVFSY